MSNFKLHSPWEPAGDQPNAIEELTEGIQNNDKFQTLLGITGSGKTRTVAGVIENVQKPTLVMSHNKTLAAQLYRELSDFFPDNRVEFFISYYDYYQPEAYLSSQDKYIEKDLSINEEIQKLRLRATSSLLSGRRDVIIVSSVSCIYGIGSPSEYEKLIINLKVGQDIPRNTLLYDLVDLHYRRSDHEFTRGTFRVRGDVVDIYPAYSEEGLRITMWGDEIEKMQVFDVESGNIIDDVDEFRIYPASHYVTTQSRLEESIKQIRDEMHWRVDVLQDEQRFLEAKRLEQRTLFDIEMMQEIGYCSGIENYSRYLSARKPGERPYTLMDYFPDDYLLIVDESHQTVPQVGAMYGGDRSRKIELVEHGFRLPSAMDNRPLTFEEWESMVNQAIFVSATPSDYELEKSDGIYVEQIIRPTGLMEPEIEVRPLDTQVDDLLEEIRKRAEKNERVLCITLTKRLSEELSEYLKNLGIPAAYMHSELDAMQRVEVLYKFRRGDFKVLVGINLLREGIDIPELSLVAILDADKEGFLRSETALFQIVGRAARNVGGKAILYANKITKSMQKVIDETNRRREIQRKYNEEHGITPQTIQKELKPLVDPTLISTQDFTLDSTEQEQQDYLETVRVAEDGIQYKANPAMKEVTFENKEKFLEYLRGSMLQAAKNMEFEEAARIRDQIATLEKKYKSITDYFMGKKIEFFKTFVKDRDVASVIPTSPRCVKKVCSNIDFTKDFTLVEYGPGNGAFTHFLIENMSPGSKLILIEANQNFVSSLKDSIDDPRVEIHNVLAGDVESVLSDDVIGNVDYVLSGIPFSFLEWDRKIEVLQATKKILKDDGKFLAYQTSGHLKKPVMEVFGNFETDFEPLNIPPYFIYKIHKNGH